MTQLHRAAGEAGSDWKPAIQQTFRRLILQRVRAHLADGNRVPPPYENHGGQTWPAMSFASVLGHLFLIEHLPRFTEYLSHYPQTREPQVESFVYWSKERVAGKAMISATHVSILRNSGASLPDALVAGTQIFVTRYVNASLGITAILRGGSGADNYLVYLNRSEVDVLSGMFGGLVRWLVQRRLKAEAANALQGLRRRLESGEPPPNYLLLRNVLQPA